MTILVAQVVKTAEETAIQKKRLLPEGEVVLRELEKRPSTNRWGRIDGSNGDKPRRGDCGENVKRGRN